MNLLILDYTGIEAKLSVYVRSQYRISVFCSISRKKGGDRKRTESGRYSTRAKRERTENISLLPFVVQSHTFHTLFILILIFTP